jgi:hypothetical protein
MLNCTQDRDSNNTKDNGGKTEKTGKPVSPQQNISTGTRGEWRKQILRSRLQQMKINYAKGPNEAHRII